MKMINLHALPLTTKWNENAMYPLVFTMRGLSTTSGGSMELPSTILLQYSGSDILAKILISKFARIQADSSQIKSATHYTQWRRICIFSQNLCKNPNAFSQDAVNFSRSNEMQEIIKCYKIPLETNMM